MITPRRLCLTLVRPILEYCCHAWDPFLSKDIELLEPIQKFVIKVWQSDGVGRTAQRNSLILPLLKERRAVIKACHGLQVPEWSNCHASKYFCSPRPLKLGPAVTQQLHLFASVCHYGTSSLEVCIIVSHFPFVLSTLLNCF